MINVETKICHKCGRTKSINDFGKHKIENDGLQSICRLCKSAIDKEYRNKTDYNKKNYIKINIKNRNIRHRYIESWRSFFKNIYGENPPCEICGKILSFSNNKKELSVHFDHKHEGNESIKITPSWWYQTRPCSKENINIFISCNFGILCCRCNILLPTLNRIDWLEKALNYAKKTETYLNY